MKKHHLLGVILLCSGLFSCSSGVIQQANYEVIPLPQEIKITTGNFVLNDRTSIVYPKDNKEMQQNANLLAEYIHQMSGKKLKVTDEPVTSNAIILATGLNADNAEAYQLKVTQDNVTITGTSEAGTFYGIQTLRKSLPITNKGDISLPAAEINDYPRFSYRGVHLDVSRHFFPADSVKHFIDMMALHNINRLHWHLTDDQGWRLEVKSLPKLTAIGAWRAPRVGNWWEREPQLPTDSLSYGGYYTTEDIREIVEYAQQRYVTIVPEIDIPGHSMAALSAYPEISCTGGPFHVNVGNTFYTKIENSLCAGNEQTFEVLDSVFAEVARLFPSPYIHIGGDECYKGFWEKCPKCKIRMQKEHLKNLEELQSYFVKRVAAMVQKRGKQVIGWDEILEGGLAPEAIVMSWRGMKGGIEAAKQGHSVIMTPTDHCYLDFYQGDPTVEPNTYSMLRLQDCYKYQLIPDSVDASLIMGGQGNLWTESVPHYRQVEYMIWPRALAISETLWTDARLRNWKFFVNRVEQQFERFDRSGVNYARSIYDPIIYPHWDKERQLKIAMKTEIEGLSLFYTFDNTIPDIYSNMYTDTLSIPKNASMLRVAAYKGQEQAGRLIDITIDALKKRAAEGEKK